MDIPPFAPLPGLKTIWLWVGGARGMRRAWKPLSFTPRFNLMLDMRRRILKPVETDEDLTLALGTEKCRGSVLSLADCFALALARRVGGTLLTTDSQLGRTKGIGVKYLQIE